jgi:hypothetical protein
MVVAIDLKQFPNHEECTWVKGLISLSKEFFDRTERMGNYLMLEKEKNINLGLGLLNESSGMDFTYSKCKLNTIEELIVELTQ